MELSNMPNRIFHTLYYNAWYQSEHNKDAAVTDSDLEDMVDEMTN